MKTMFRLNFLLTLVFIISSVLQAQSVIVTSANVEGHTVTIDASAGVHWTQTTQFGNTIPQIAIWLEDENGNYFQSIYVTRAFGQQRMNGLSTNFNAVFRRYSLPYWLTRHYSFTGKYPTQFNRLPDTISQATPRSSFVVETKITNTIRTGYVFCEVNNMGDTNFTYTGNDGQPSILYRGLVNFKKPGIYELTPFAITTPTYEGMYKTNFAGITTADKILRAITVRVW